MTIQSRGRDNEAVFKTHKVALVEQTVVVCTAKVFGALAGVNNFSVVGAWELDGTVMTISERGDDNAVGWDDEDSVRRRGEQHSHQG